MRTPSKRTLLLGLLFFVASASHVQAAGKPTADTSTKSASVIPSVPTAKVQADSGPKASESRETYRGFYVDMAAALFAWLAVAFAVMTVGFTIIGIREFRDVKRKIEQELKNTIQTQLNEKIQALTEQTIRPKIQDVLDQELRKKLDVTVAQFNAEVAKSLQDKDFTARLVDTVTDEIKARLSKPQGPGVTPKEFEPQ